MNDDWRDLLVTFRAAHVRCLIVGAHALAVHGVPRGTQDLDLWLDPSPQNAERAWHALLEWGAPLETLGISRGDLAREDVVIQLGLPPHRIDLLTSLTGLSNFAEAWQDRLEVDFEGTTVDVLSRAQLVRTKRATGRRKDLSDLEALGELPPT